MMSEEWRRYGLSRYECSSMGRVRTIPTVVYCPLNGRRTISGRLMKPARNNCYKVLEHVVGGKRVVVLAHRLIAELFVENPHGKPFVNHKDGKKHNNHPDNLEWVTHAENIMHSVETGLSKTRKMVACADREGNEIMFRSLRQASADTGVSAPCICAALKGNQKTAGGLKWRYVEDCEYLKLKEAQVA